jgi:DNA-binding GntR family transcriptional regulator
MLPRRTLTDAAAAALRDRILHGALAAGEPLRQEALAQELGVSRIPLREALQRLEAEGLVVLLPHRGAVVADLPLDQVRELFELRAMLETDLIRRAVPRATARDHAEVRAASEAFAAALGAGAVSDLGAANFRFHQSLYRPAHRPQSMELFARLHQQSDRFLRLQLTLTDGGARAVREHRAIAAAARRRDAAGAARLIRQHILGAGERLERALAANHALEAAG